MPTLSFPKYSFVQAGPLTAPWSPTYCTPDPAFCLPISTANNLQFYAYINDIDVSAHGLDVSDYLQPLNTHPNAWVAYAYAFAVPVDYPEPLPAALASYISTNLGSYVFFSNHQSTGGTNTSFNCEFHFVEKNGSELPSTLEVGSCFKLMLVSELRPLNGNPSFYTFAGFTNCFQRISPNSCYVSTLVYSNNSNAFDFQFLQGGDALPGGIVRPPDNNNYLPNIVELPIYLRDPVMENDQKVYTKSDGTIVKLYERKEEIYILESDLMPYAWHKALDIALSHDTVFILNQNVTGFDPLNTAIQFVKKENYVIEYNKAPLSAMGKGSCKLSNANAIHLINNNCG